MFMKEKFETVAWRSSLVTISSFLYGVNWSFHRRSIIWKINTRDASEGRLSELPNVPVKATVIVYRQSAWRICKQPRKLVRQRDKFSFLCCGII